jgi:hypothetical protein
MVLKFKWMAVITAELFTQKRRLGYRSDLMTTLISEFGHAVASLFVVPGVYLKWRRTQVERGGPA